ncbi:GTPase [Klebsiella oxytoca]|nr:GTPase [Klebsiella oxytoca]
MFLNYFALGVLIFVFLVIFYGIIILHDIPYLIAKKRNHPHADAIHVAGWGESFYSARYLAVFMDLGHALSA